MPAMMSLADFVAREPVVLPSTATVQRACQAMYEENVGAIPVVDEGKGLVGIFTGRDLVRLLAEGRNPAHAHLSAVMTKNPATLPPQADAAEAVRLMRDGGFRHLPVVDRGRVVGLVSRGDMARVQDDPKRQ